MAYDPNKPFSYGLPNGTYTGTPTTASCFEKGGKLILDVRFAVRDPNTGDYYKKDNGYPIEINKRHWLTNADGAFNEMTINGIREWAKGWNPTCFDDFYWFQNPDAGSVPFGNLAAIGDVELNISMDRDGSQQLWVHDPNRQRGGRKVFVPDGAITDTAVIKAKWGSKAKALFGSMPKPVGNAPTAAPAVPAPAAPAVSPARPAAVPARPAAGSPWDTYPRSVDGAFAYYCSTLGEPYQSAKHDEKWFGIYDRVAEGKDPDQFTPADVQALFRAVQAG